MAQVDGESSTEEKKELSRWSVPAVLEVNLGHPEQQPPKSSLSSPKPSGREVPGVEDTLALDVLKVRVEKRQDWHVLGQDLLHAGYHF
jgi:hypothetical protein